jgi:hypothetical protein
MAETAVTYIRNRAQQAASEGTTLIEYELHPACAAWPEMSPKELAALADDIALNGLREPITLTPDGQLLDGRNRALACEMAGVEIPAGKIETYDGDPWLFSISRNARRRHMVSVDAIAMVVARLTKRERGENRGAGGRFTDGSNEPTVAEAAKAAGISETAVKSAKVVLEHGTPEEIVEASQKGKGRKVANTVRARQQDAKPAPSTQPAPSKPKRAKVDINDPNRVILVMINKCAGGKWRTAVGLSQAVDTAKSTPGTA